MNITLSDEELDILKKRAKKNLMTLKEQVEDVVRRSCANYNKSNTSSEDKCDDKLVGIFSRNKRGKIKKKKRKKLVKYTKEIDE